ncbi:hypothetical protein [Campylobacter sp. RM16192]|uniref:hypothetical protein n=1 Tax=Campylobacter sp. RM16192 TaxID=1660080 RepID=UPI00145296E9|nr:hypothetical protein [Campylobacter sp. RM16192]QCD52489.1 hypothetical protein CDOMC_0866 [Campylobacter sp. RM16192]
MPDFQKQKSDIKLFLQADISANELEILKLQAQIAKCEARVAKAKELLEVVESKKSLQEVKDLLTNIFRQRKYSAESLERSLSSFIYEVVGEIGKGD